MIKDDMTLPLGIDTQYIKSTGGVFTTATDAEILPYTIGYIPYSMLENARIFKNVGKYTNTSVPNVSFRTIRQNMLYEPSKGVPFVYTIKTIQENQNFHGFYDTTGNTWNTSFIGSSNTNLRALHSYNTDHFVNDSGNNGMNVTGIRITFIFFETLGNGGWGGTSPQTVAEKIRVSVTATFSAVYPDIALSFSTSVSSSFGTHTYTIDNSIFNAMDENGVFRIDGGTYSSGGSDFERHLFGAIEQIYVETSGQSLAPNEPGFGVIIAENFRNSQTLNEQNHTNVRNTYGTQSTNYLVSANECMYLFDSQFGYFWEYALNDVSLFRFAVSSWINCPVFCGATWSDILICICTALPAYKINNAWYVAEFTDDYYITGKLIPYSDAREWQKNINGDTNVFDPADIPEPGPGPDDEDQTGGVDWNPNTVFAVDSLDGFVTMYALRADQITRFGQYLWAEMWSDDFLNSIGVIFNQNLSLNPSEILNYIVSVRCYPFSISGMAGAAPVPDTIYLGRGAEGIGLNSGFNILRLSSYSEDIDGGTATIPTYYGDFRDYEPCSKITVFVPFCGALELAPSQAVGNKVHLRYCVDFSSGAIQATVSIEGAKNNYIAGILTGTVGATVELSASNLSQVIQKVGGLAFNVAKTAALFAIGGEALEGAETLEEGSKALAPFTASAAETISSVADMSTGVPTTLGTTAGFSAFQVTTPIVRIERRHYEVPDNYAHVYGYACNYSAKLETLKGKGYTVCKNVDLEGVPATQDELALIESLLQSGVYF